MALRQKFADLLEKHRYAAFVTAPMLLVFPAVVASFNYAAKGTLGLPGITQTSDAAAQKQELDQLQESMTVLRRKVTTGHDMHELLEGAPKGTQEAVAANLVKLERKLAQQADDYASTLLTKQGISEWSFKDYAGFLGANKISTSFDFSAMNANSLRACQKEHNAAADIAQCMKQPVWKSYDAFHKEVLVPSIVYSSIVLAFLLVGTESSIKGNRLAYTTWQSFWINRLREEKKKKGDGSELKTEPAADKNNTGKPAAPAPV